MHILKITTQGKKDLKKIKKRSLSDLSLVSNFINLLIEKSFSDIPSINKPHKLIGNYKDCYEAHIKPDLLIIWREEVNGISIIRIIRVGSHSDLF